MQVTGNLSNYHEDGQPAGYHVGMNSIRPSVEPYITAVKKRLNYRTYQETMGHIGLPKQAWTKIQKGSGLSDKNAIRIAQVLDIDPLEIIAVSMACRAENNEIRDFWLKTAKKIKNQSVAEGMKVKETD